MKSPSIRLALGAGIVSASFALTEFLWIRGQNATALMLIFAVASAVLAWSQASGAVWPLPLPEETRPRETAAPHAGGAPTLLFCAGLALAAAAFRLALADRLGPAAAALILAALAWAPLVDARPQTLSKRSVAGLILAVLLAGAGFRFYRAGAVPAGLITVDEPRLNMYAHQILDGQRESFNTVACEGEIPFAVEAFAMRVFGETITGFRMSCICSGMLMLGLMALLGAELAGVRVGLAAAALTAVAVWPVSFSRAEYLMASSYLPALGCFWLFLRGLRRGSPLNLVLAGFCFGLCFNVYQADRLTMPVLVPALAALLWLQRPDWRKPLKAALAPFLGGTLIALAPLILWFLQDPHGNFQIYLAPFFYSFISGDQIVAQASMLSKLNGVVSRILPEFCKVAGMFTNHGGMRPWYFSLDEPVVDRATLFLFLSGLSVCLVRFRKPTLALLVVWWFVGLMPTLVSNPQLDMDERRIMMSLPATFFLAGLGLTTLLDLGLRPLAAGLRDRAALFLLALFFAAYAANNAHTYFTLIQHDRGHQDYDHDNFDNMLRGIFTENSKAPVSVLSFRKPDPANWYGSNDSNELVEHWNVLGHIPRMIASTDASYLSGGGLFGALRRLDLSQKRDPLIVLTPFHYYLEPLLVGELGGTQVADIAPMSTLDDIDGGINYTDVGMATDKKSATRIIRLRHFDPSRLTALEGRWLYPYSVEELTPPASLGDRAKLASLWLLEPKHIRTLEAYDHNPRRWRASKTTTFEVADPYFWITSGNFPGNPQPPLRLRAHWILRVPEDGLYALGGSSTDYLALSVDGKRVYTYIPRDRREFEKERDGTLGSPVALKAGDHALDVDQVFLSSGGNYNNLIRLQWQKPGGQKETLPLEFLLPGAAGHP